MQRALAWLKGSAAAAGGSDPVMAADAVGPGQPIIIPVEAIQPNRFQPRQHFDGEELDSLATSIRRVGILQPVVVRPAASGFELIMGERRWRAAIMAGLQAIPALVQQVPDDAAAVLALVENVQRANLDFWEEAEGYQMVLDRFPITQAELAAAVGRRQSTIANKLRLLRLPAAAKNKARHAGLTERHMRALLKVTEADQLNSLLDLVVADNLTVRDTEALVEQSLAAEAGGGQGDGKRHRQRGPRGLRMIRDVRIMMNTFRQGVEALRKAGLDADMATADHGEHLTVTIRIPKQRRVK